MSDAVEVQNMRKDQKLAQLFDAAGSLEEYATGYIANMTQALQSMDMPTVVKAVEIIEACAEKDQTFFILGNGGSGAFAGHWANDLSANTVVEGTPGFRVMSLCDNAFSITAIANDASYEEIFSIQLKANMRPGDVVLALSVSGNSPNILRGVEYANENGAYTIGCCGFKGGKLKEISQLCIHMPSSKDEYGPIEDMFSVFMHIAQSYIAMRRGRYLCH